MDLETYMLTVFWSLWSIETRPEAKFVSAHEIGPFMVLAQCSIECSAEHQTANRVPITVIPLGKPKPKSISIKQGIGAASIAQDIHEGQVLLQHHLWEC